MKAVIVGDIHLGKNSVEQVKKDKLFKSQELFFNTLRDFCTKEGIKTILWTGDVFDTTKTVESNIIQYGVNLFHKIFSDCQHHIILGNHCLYNRDSLEVSSLACLENLSNVTVYRKPTRVDILGKKMLFVPFLVSEIFSKFSENIKKIGSQNDAVLGHFDIIGAKMESGKDSLVGLDMNSLLNNIKLTISGHYHNISEYVRGSNKIQYVGTPYQLTFGDAKQDRGFWTLDEEYNMEFIKNEVSYEFIKINENNIDNIDDLRKYFVNCSYSANISDEELFQLNKKLEKLNPISFKTEPKAIEKIDEISTESEDEKVTEMSEAINVGDMLKVCDVYMEVEPPKNKSKVDTLLKKIKDNLK